MNIVRILIMLVAAVLGALIAYFVFHLSPLLCTVLGGIVGGVTIGLLHSRIGRGSETPSPV